MVVARLALTDFRSYPHVLIEPAAGLVILTGENGAGKTNLLEAVSLLAPGRGLRQAALGQVTRVGGSGFAVAARLDDAVEIGTGAVVDAPERRQVRINGVAAPATALAERLAVLWLTPAMDRLFAEGAGGRRRFFDRLVLALEPDHAIHATRYESAMRARTRLLTGERAPDPVWLDALEAAMAEHGAALGQARERLGEALAERLAAAASGPFARATLALERNGEDEEPLRDRLRTSRVRDAQAGRALVGPHRFDVLVGHRDRAVPAALCSTGEQKALLLGLVLAHADLVAERVGRRPILLLDEVAAHLDPLRRAALLERLGAAGGQVWMTGTEPALFADAPPASQRLIVHDGGVTNA